MSRYEAESEPYEAREDSSDDWNDRDEECTCRFSGDQADSSGCYAHGDFAAAAREREALELPRREMLTEAGCTQAQSDAYIREVA